MNSDSVRVAFSDTGIAAARGGPKQPRRQQRSTTMEQKTLTADIPDRMCAVLLTGYGGLDKLEYRNDVEVPKPQAGEVLIRVGAAGVNNTDINTRLGWYAKSVTTATDATEQSGEPGEDASSAAWSGAVLTFPRIQGADVCGVIVAVGDGVEPRRMGERVIVAPLQRSRASDDDAFWMLGADGDGGFAQYTKTNAVEAVAIDSRYSDVELASFPCAYSTAENLLHHSRVTQADTVLITGGSGGVGSAAIQLAKRRHARVLTVSTEDKASALLALGADGVVPRGERLLDHVGAEQVDVVIDLVAGPQWSELLDVLKRGGRYAVAGAIAGPIVELDVRTLYLKDLTLLGRTLQAPEIFTNLARYIEAEEIKPLVARTYPLRDIARAQTDFLAKQFVGKLVLVPD